MHLRCTFNEFYLILSDRFSQLTPSLSLKSASTKSQDVYVRQREEKNPFYLFLFSHGCQCQCEYGVASPFHIIIVAYYLLFYYSIQISNRYTNNV